MSDTTTDTSVIDEKKAENDITSSNNSPDYWSNLGNLILTLIFIIIFILLYFAFGVYTLYICKISQSNILPTSADCFPFSDGKPTVTPIQTNIFKSDDKSIKLSFPYEENSDFAFLKILREYKNSSDSNNVLNYFISIIETLISFDFNFINITFNTLNRLPEGLLVFFGPFILVAIFLILFLCNCYYGLFLWFFNMSWLFKKNTNIERGKKPVWEDVTLLQPFSYCLGIFLVIIFSLQLLFCCLFYIGIDMLISLFCLNVIFTFTGIMVTKPIEFSNLFTEALKVHKISLMVIVSILVVSIAFAYLGISGVISSLLVLGLIIFGFIHIDMFKSITETNMTPFSVAREAQAKREMCKMVDNKIFGKGNQRGGQLVNELKKLNKNK